LTGVISVGGSGGTGGDAGNVDVTNQGGTITTTGDSADGIDAQSIGGAGGARALSLANGVLSPTTPPMGASVQISVGGNGGVSGNGGNVTVDNSSAINTSGGDAIGIFAYSIGGGDGGDADLGVPVSIRTTASCTGASPALETIPAGRVGLL
jgi:hypothetical protein